LKLARDAVEHVEAHSMGEIPAIIERCPEVLSALSAGAEAPDDRRIRYRRQAAVLNFVILVNDMAAHHTGTRSRQRKSVDALRDLVSDALGHFAGPGRGLNGPRDLSRRDRRA